MKWFLWLSVILLTANLVYSGRIVRTWRRHGVGSRIQLRPRPYSLWSYFTRRPRILRRNYYQQFPYEKRESQSPQQRIASIQIPATSSRFQDPKNSGWQPLNYGNPIDRDPTFDYAPPANEQVKFSLPRRRRPPLGRHEVREWRGPRPPHPLWKLLGFKQRGYPPRAPSGHELEPDEAEVTQYVPNIVYFQPNDVLPSTTASTVSLRPGSVSDVPLYPTQVTAASEFKPMPNNEVTTGKDFIFRVVNYLGGHPKKVASVLKPASSTPETKSSTQNSAPTPVEPTESLFDLFDPPDPINSFNINIDVAAEGSSEFIKVVPAPQKSTTPSTTTTIITTTTIKVPKPIFALRSTEEPTTTEFTTSSTSRTTSTSTIPQTTIFKLPTMPAYKSQQPVFPRKTANVTKGSREQMSEGEISSSIMITGIRSKVKEYKPQMLANYTQLLAFDKVSETTEESSLLTTTSLRPNNTSTSVVLKTSTSPMQSFDPLNMIHSWFMKT